MDQLQSTAAGNARPNPRWPLAAGGFLTIWVAYGLSWIPGGALYSAGPVAALAIAYLVSVVVFFEPVQADDVRSGFVPDLPQDELKDRLYALDEANEVFGTSLSAADMFRLVSSRIGEIFEFETVCLLLPDETGTALRISQADGLNGSTFRDVEVPVGNSLAGTALRSAQIEIDNTLAGDTAGIGEERLRGFVSAVAIPLSDGDKPFAVLQLFTGKQIDQSSEIVKVLQAVRDHVTPIFRSSLAFERSLTNALTDAVTGLPNERAFRMVLENHLAESARHREARPLSVLTIDIRDFAAVNTMLGHAAGDRLLEFAARRIGESLRRMDFLARTVNDEFNIILPTATEKVALEIIDRIKRGFESAEFDIGGGESFSVALNIGWASFWKDGETGDQLLRAAHQRRRQAKSETPQGVLWFPKEYVH
jgi:diguanylate cyclase (GGDEF)-like protein